MKYIDLGLPSNTRWADVDLMENTQNHSTACVFSIPTLAQFEELQTKCRWKLIINKYFKGFKVIGPNSAFIFIPFKDTSNRISRYWLKDTYNDENSWYYYINNLGPCASYWNNSSLYCVRTVYKPS